MWPSTQACQILKLLRLGGVQDHSGHSRTSQPWTPQPPSWKATSQDFADTEPIHTNIELVGLLTILQNQTIFEISIRTISIGNLDLVLRLPISTARHDKLAISTPIQMMGFFQIPVRQLSREETIGVIETKGVMVSSETIWNEVQVARTAGWVFHVILLATSTYANGTDTRTYFTLSTTTHKQPRDQSDNVGKADKDWTRFLNFSHTTRPSMNVFQYHTKFTTVSARRNHDITNAF